MLWAVYHNLLKVKGRNQPWNCDLGALRSALKSSVALSCTSQTKMTIFEFHSLRRTNTHTSHTNKILFSTYGQNAFFLQTNLRSSISTAQRLTIDLDRSKQHGTHQPQLSKHRSLVFGTTPQRDASHALTSLSITPCSRMPMLTSELLAAALSLLLTFMGRPMSLPRCQST